MAKTNLSGAQKLLKIVLDQVAGEGDPKRQLIPAYAIQGKGDIMCWDPNSRMMHLQNAASRSAIQKKYFY